MIICFFKTGAQAPINTAFLKILCLDENHLRIDKHFSLRSLPDASLGDMSLVLEM